MRVFIRVVDRGSMSEAARDLGKVQSYVSGRVDALERHLGVRLLHRTSRAMHCTDEGTEFYARCKVAIALADDALACVEQRKESLSGALRVAAPQCFGDLVLPQVMSRLMERHPRLEIDLSVNDRAINADQEGVDVAFHLGPVAIDSPSASVLGCLHRSLVASPDYLSQHQEIRTPSDLRCHPFIQLKGCFGDALPLKFREAPALPMVEAPITPGVASSHWQPMYELILGGHGIGVIQAPSCADALQRGQLVQLLPDYKLPRLELTALFPPDRPAAPKARELLAATRLQLAKVPGFVLHQSPTQDT